MGLKTEKSSIRVSHIIFKFNYIHNLDLFTVISILLRTEKNLETLNA